MPVLGFEPTRTSQLQDALQPYSLTSAKDLSAYVCTGAAAEAIKQAARDGFVHLHRSGVGEGCHHRRLVVCADAGQPCAQLGRACLHTMHSLYA